MVSHVVMNWPWHYLQKIAIEWRRQASSIGRTGAGWMEVIHIDARAQDLKELWKCVAPFGKPRFVRCQIPRDDVWKWTWTRERTKIPTTTQVGHGVDLRRLTKVWIATRSELALRASAVASIAVGLRVDNVTAKSHQCTVLAFKIQRNRGDCEPPFNP
jgi:hypothetical protein